MLNKNVENEDKSSNKNLTQWVKTHKPATIAIAVILAVAIGLIIAFACGSFKSEKKLPANSNKAEQKAITGEMKLTPIADKDWTETSSPAIFHIKGIDEDNKDIEFYHAVSSTEPNKGASNVKVNKGTYLVEVISPVNCNGSIYSTCDEGESKKIKVGADKTIAVCVDIKLIATDKVTNEQVNRIVENTKIAVEKGDKSLKGNNGKTILDTVSKNVSNSPTASTKTKEIAKETAKKTNTNSKPVNSISRKSVASTSGKTNNKANSEVDTKSNNKSTNNETEANTKSKTSDSSKTTSHEHNWVAHKATRHVPKIVTVTRYEKRSRLVSADYRFEYDGYIAHSRQEVANHERYLKINYYINHPKYKMINPVYVYYDEPVGTRKEDHGYDETYVDYYYCTICGAKKDA